MVMKIGEIDRSGKGVGHRDAFHVAAILVVTYDDLEPGDHVVFSDGFLNCVDKVGKQDEYHAVVDPFVSDIEKNNSFWVLLRPHLVDKLSHNFEVAVPGAHKYYGPQEDDDDGGCRAMGCE